MKETSATGKLPKEEPQAMEGCIINGVMRKAEKKKTT